MVDHAGKQNFRKLNSYILPRLCEALNSNIFGYFCHLGKYYLWANCYEFLNFNGWHHQATVNKLAH